MTLLRATILAALVVMLGASLGMAGDGHKIIRQYLDFPKIDTTAILVGDEAGQSKINDTVFFAFPSFHYDGPWTDMSIVFVPATKDTATQTGLAIDTVVWHLQTKSEQDSANWWHTIASTSAIPMLSYDSTAAPDTTRGYAPVFKTAPDPTDVGWGNLPISDVRLYHSDSDSAGVGRGLYRILSEYHVEPDSIISHCTLRSSSIVDVMETFWAIIRFHLR